ncbi:hypothetical protein ACO0RG_002519 [Hanseniaspora osmophila]
MTIKSIAVIGAGPTGAGLVKALIKERHFAKIKVFEKRNSFGGLWNYTKPQINKSHISDAAKTYLEKVPLDNPFHRISPIACQQMGSQDSTKKSLVFDSAVYRDLDTNVPKTLMEYNKFPFPADAPLFPTRDTVLKYLSDFADPIKKHVQFNTEIVDLQYDPQSAKYKIGYIDHAPAPQKTKQESSTVYDPEEYDAVVIATGIYDLPYVPSKPGLEKWFKTYPESVLHSKNYDSVDQFKDVKGEIVIVGNSASGNDLAYQLASKFKRKIYKSKRSESALPGGKSSFIVELGDISEMNSANKSISFTDGTTVENVEKVIFCTGFLKSFPFLPTSQNNKQTSPLSNLITDGKMVHNLYNHILPINLPTLAFIGLPKYSLPTRLSETQGAWLARVWSGKIALPSKELQWKYHHWFKAKNETESKYHEIGFPMDVQYSQRLNREIRHAGNANGYFGIEWTGDQIKVRSSIKPLKEGYIKYFEETGQRASSVQELIEQGYFEWPEDAVSCVQVPSFAP